MRNSNRCLWAVPFAMISVAACAPGAAPPPASVSAPAPTPSAVAPAPSAEPAQAAATPAAPAADPEKYDDPGELSDPATLTPIVGEHEHLSFPHGTVDEHTCWQTLALSGDARRDFAALVDRCGTPTGAIEYAKPIAGRLHHRLDKRDTYVIRIRGGLCYRFFGVGDGGIHDLDILVERDGALQGEDRTNGPVAIIDSDKSWCMNVSGDYQFHVQLKNEGQGEYVFGVWARAATSE